KLFGGGEPVVHHDKTGDKSSSDKSPGDKSTGDKGVLDKETTDKGVFDKPPPTDKDDDKARDKGPADKRPKDKGTDKGPSDKTADKVKPPPPGDGLHPRRALLISVCNYLYANTVHYGDEADHDPKGLRKGKAYPGSSTSALKFFMESPPMKMASNQIG